LANSAIEQFFHINQCVTAMQPTVSWCRNGRGENTKY
jgi:hypothetical protein